MSVCLENAIIILIVTMASVSEQCWIWFPQYGEDPPSKGFGSGLLKRMQHPNMDTTGLPQKHKKLINECPPDEEFKVCDCADLTCRRPEKPENCRQVCFPRCVCKDPLVRLEKTDVGPKCIHPGECPQDSTPADSSSTHSPSTDSSSTDSPSTVSTSTDSSFTDSTSTISTLIVSPSTVSNPTDFPSSDSLHTNSPSAV